MIPLSELLDAADAIQSGDPRALLAAERLSVRFWAELGKWAKLHRELAVLCHPDPSRQDALALHQRGAAIYHLGKVAQELPWVAALAAPTRVFDHDVSWIDQRWRYGLMLQYGMAASGLTPEQFNFWTCRDLGVQPALQVRPEAYHLYDRAADREEIERLALLRVAFRDQLLAEVPAHPLPAVGVYTMRHEPFADVDSQIDYHTLRLIVEPRGVWVTLVGAQQCMPTYWSPGYNTFAVSYGGLLQYMLDVLLAGIWRDACVVREQWATERSRSEYIPQGRKGSSRVVVLPRLIRHVAWGASDAEREAIIRMAHNVRGHYRRLGDESQASEAARLAAGEYGLPEPPAGFTFVRPHLRGTGEADHSIPRVVCRGLRTVKVALG